MQLVEQGTATGISQSLENKIHITTGRVIHATKRLHVKKSLRNRGEFVSHAMPAPAAKITLFLVAGRRAQVRERSVLPEAPDIPASDPGKPSIRSPASNTMSAIRSR